MNGITRGKIIKVCQDNGIPVYEKNFSLTDVYDADEVFVTGTFGGVTPVNKIDGRLIGDETSRPLSDKIRQLYQEAKKQYIQTANKPTIVTT